MEALQYLEQHRQVKTLKSGMRVLLRPLTPEDAEGLVALFASATPDDATYMRHDVTDRELVTAWAREVNLLKVFPLVAEVNGRIVGDATLHFGTGYRHHLAWVRIFLSPEFRRLGIGTLMLRNLFSIARRLGLQQVIAEVLSTQVQIMKALEALDFEREYRHRDYFITAAGETVDMDVYVLRLAEPGAQF
jgi:RimJ/RimL family protein N-acetyltransferase